jgi:polyhydroxyalkanoate synthesis repressor PhaR
MNPAPPSRVLKKYGNRRLYDTEASKYVTLAEVEGLIQEGADITVVDAKSGDDLTREVLTQIICDREQSRDVLPVSFLKQVIRTGGSPEARERFTDHLLGSLRGFADAQRAFAAEVQKAAATSFRSNPFLNPFGAYPQPSRAQSVDAPPPEAIYGAQVETRAELDEMKAELKATQALLKELVHAQRAPEPEPKPAKKKRARRKKSAS